MTRVPEKGKTNSSDVSGDLQDRTKFSPEPLPSQRVRINYVVDQAANLLSKALNDLQTNPIFAASRPRPFIFEPKHVSLSFNAL